MIPPLPVPNPDNREFWDGCRRHELRIQRCLDCRTTRFHPRPACPRCASFRTEWIVCSGRGRVYTWTVVHPPTLPAFRERTPYAAGLIELDEKVFMVGEIRGVTPAKIAVGLRVRVAFDDLSQELSLPYWQL
jgi:uncharacterized OB-fold protein